MSPRKKAAAPGSALLIKRYSNRKLYNTRESRYITLDELADLIKAGTNVRVVDNDSTEDLTSVTLSQILLARSFRFDGYSRRQWGGCRS